MNWTSDHGCQHIILEQFREEMTWWQVMEVSHWNGKVCLFMKLSLWPTPEVVKMTIFCAASYDSFFKIETFSGMMLIDAPQQYRHSSISHQHTAWERQKGWNLWSHCKHKVSVIMTTTLCVIFDKFPHSPCLPSLPVLIHHTRHTNVHFSQHISLNYLEYIWCCTLQLKPCLQCWAQNFIPVLV